MRFSRIFSILTLVIFISNSSYSQDKPFIHTVQSINNIIPVGYVPPVISNGSLSIQVDFLGEQRQKAYVGMIPGIYWEGRRYGSPNNYHLIPFGHFTDDIYKNRKLLKSPETWTQILNTKEGTVSCLNDYKDFEIKSDVFIPFAHDLIAIKKRFISKSSGSQIIKFNFNYQFTPPGNENSAPKRTIIQEGWNKKTQSMEYRYKAYGQNDYNGIISIFSDAPVTPVIEGQKVELTSDINLSSGEVKEVTFYLLFSDSMEDSNYESNLRKLETQVRQVGFNGLLDFNRIEWNKYWDNSFVHLPVKKLEEVYNTAQYHLRVNSTKWSFPVGIFPSHWSGRYFGWDEMFCFQAMASSNHLNISRRVPEFRFSGLPIAQKRVQHYNNPGKYGARYPWITLEDGIDGTTTGFWIDHVFHMANITLSCWLQYLYTGDKIYLESIGYPVIKECARFFISHEVYHDSNGKVYIGKVTDLERLGPAKENTFLTTCGAIYTLEAAAAAAKALNVDEQEAQNWKQIAMELEKNLPRDNEKYIPYPGCKEKSVAVLAGLFPYPLFNKKNLLQYNAAYDFYQNARTAGNMYPVGSGISPWYAGTIAAAVALLDDRDKPEELLLEAANTSGCFDELFEINETEVSMHPWFSTASGNVIYAVNQMLLQCQDNNISILPAVPNTWQNISFKLASYGDLICSVNLNGGQIKRLLLIPGDSTQNVERTLIIPQQYIKKKSINMKIVKSIDLKEESFWLHVKFQGNENLIL